MPPCIELIALPWGLLKQNVMKPIMVYITQTEKCPTVITPDTLQQFERLIVLFQDFFK